MANYHLAFFNEDYDSEKDEWAGNALGKAHEWITRERAKNPNFRVYSVNGDTESIEVFYWVA